MTNAAYQLLRELGMRPAIARHFLVRLRQGGFVVVKEAQVTKVSEIKQKLLPLRHGMKGAG